MNIISILREQAAARPEAAAIIDTHRGETRVTTFGQLDQASSQAAELLLRQGLLRGDAVLVLHPMSAELYVALIAIFSLEMVAMFLDPSAGRDHIERCCALHRPRGFIGSPKAHLLRFWSSALRKIPVKIVIGLTLPGTVSWSSLERLPRCEQTVESAEETPALLTFTSGSTGQPKAAVRTHGFLLAQHRALAQSLELTEGDVDLATMPIVLLANLASGVTSVIPSADLRRPGAIDPAPVISQMQTHKVVSSVASPALFERLGRYCIERNVTLPFVRKLFTGGAPVFPRILDQMQRMAPSAEIVAVYGSTEAEPIAHVSRAHIEPDDSRAMVGGGGLLAGRPVETIQLRIIRDQWGKSIGPYTETEFATKHLPPGEPGEIVVQGAHVLEGYLHGEGDEETKFKVDGVIWHRTGDAGYLDAAGRLWLLGRCAARIRDRHGDLYPFAAETAVYQDERVRRAAVVNHAGRRTLVLEFYDRATIADPNQLKAAFDWARIEEIRVLDQLPVDKRHNAKIDYPSLYRILEKAASHHGR